MRDCFSRKILWECYPSKSDWILFSGPEIEFESMKRMRALSDGVGAKADRLCSGLSNEAKTEF